MPIAITPRINLELYCIEYGFHGGVYDLHYANGRGNDCGDLLPCGWLVGSENADTHE